MRINRREAIIFFTGLLIAYCGFIVFLYMSQRNFIYFPDPNRPSPSAYGATDMEVIRVTTEDGLQLEGWYKAPQGGKPVIVVFHGNASHQGMSAQKIRPFLKAGYGALLPAYRGYAGNPGHPSEEGLYRDADAFVRWLTADRAVPEKNIVLYGESLGTGVAVEMAARTFSSIRALVLESPYTNFVDMARRQYFFIPFLSHLVRDRYDTLEKIGMVRAPLLIVSGGRDMVVPSQMGQDVFDAANDPKTIIDIPQAGHNDLYAFGAGEKIMTFLAGV